MRIELDTSQREAPQQGARAIVTLIHPVRYKDGKDYRTVYGPVWSGTRGEWSSNRSNPTRCLMIGTINEQDTHLIVPFANVAGIQGCNKVLKGDDILVLE